MAYVVDGLTNKEIGAAMDLAEKTVRNYLTSAFSKLNVSRRAEAATLYQRRYIATPLSHETEATTGLAIPTDKDNNPTQVFFAERR